MFFLSPCLQSLMRGLWTHMQHSTSGLGPCAVTAHRTSRTDIFGKNDFYLFPGFPPTMTGLTLRTGSDLGLPIEMEMSHVKAFALFGLPTIVCEHRPHEPHAVLLLAT